MIYCIAKVLQKLSNSLAVNCVTLFEKEKWHPGYSYILNFVAIWKNCRQMLGSRFHLSVPQNRCKISTMVCLSGDFAAMAQSLHAFTNLCLCHIWPVDKTAYEGFHSTDTIDDMYEISSTTFSEEMQTLPLFHHTLKPHCR